jgi:tetratricopeptide (TPR) repeat protein
MPPDDDRYDFFVSYAREDNRDGWISRFVERLLAEQQRVTDGRSPLRSFFDTSDIRGLDDWRLRIHDSLAQSRLLLAFVSPTYFTRPWCRREWRTWIDHEIAQHILSSGVAPIHIVEVPGLTHESDERQVARAVAALCRLAPPYEPFVEQAAPVIKQLRRRQLTSVQPFFAQGPAAFDRAELQTVLADLAGDLDQRIDKVRRAAASETNVPPYNRRFSGRLDELFELRTRLQDDHAGVISGMHGLSGIGKTELAFTFAHAFAAEYSGGRFLIPCEGQSSLRHAVLRLGDRFRDQISDEQRMTIESYFATITVCLQQRVASQGRILLVLDNVTEPQLLSAQETDALTALSPQLHLLATTRMASGATGIRWLTLGEMSEAESLELLEKCREFADDSEREAACRIARRLGGFALTVELVGAWLSVKQEVTYANFLQRLGLEEFETLHELAEDTDPGAELRRHNHERRLQAVLGPTLALLTPPARRALEYAALLPPDHVPLPWLRTLVEQDFPAAAGPPPPGHADPWADVCRELFRLALFTRGEDDAPQLVRVHRLVQLLVRRDLSPDAIAARQQALDLLVEARVEVLLNTVRWQDARWELEPLEALADKWANEDRLRAAFLLDHVGQAWYHLAEWTRAEPLQRRALAIDEQYHGAEHSEVAIRINNLAVLLQATNRLAEAEPLMRRGLAIQAKNHGPDHPYVAAQLNNLARLFRETNRLTEAEVLLRRALAIDEQSYGDEHPSVAMRLNSLAALLLATNQLAEAEPLMRRALTIDEQCYGAEHPKVAGGLNNLAQLLQATNRLAEAEPLMRRALAIDEQSYGADHPKIAIDLNNLALLVQATNRQAEAEPLMRRALAIQENSHGADHPFVARQLNNLAQLLQAMNRLTEAEPLMRRALAIDEQSYGPEHSDVARDQNNLALLLKATSRLAEAEPLMRRALATYEQSYGADHPAVAIALNNLASLLQATNRLGEAEPLIRRSLAIDEQSYGADHPNVAIRLNNLAQLLEATGCLSEAAQLMRRHVEIFRQFGENTGFQHPHMDAAISNYDRLLRKLGGTGNHPYLDRVLLKQRQARAVEAEDYRTAASCRDEISRLDQAHANYAAEFGCDTLRLLDGLAPLRCVAVPVKRAIGGRLLSAPSQAELLAELHRGLEFVTDELEEFEDFKFQELCNRLEHVTETEKLFAALGLRHAAEKVGQGLGPDAWLEYAQHVNTRADRFLYCLANRFVQSPPTKDEAFQLAEVFDQLGQPFAASALRDRFRDA